MEIRVCSTLESSTRLQRKNAISLIGCRSSCKVPAGTPPPFSFLSVSLLRLQWLALPCSSMLVGVLFFLCQICPFITWQEEKGERMRHSRGAPPSPLPPPRCGGKVGCWLSEASAASTGVNPTGMHPRTTPLRSHQDAAPAPFGS